MERYVIDAPETPDNFGEAPPNFSLPKSSLIKSREYEYKLNNEEDSYSLLMELYANNYICFKLRKINDLSSNYYFNKFNYDEMMKIFVLKKEFFSGMKTLFKFCDNLLSKKEMILEYKIEKNVMILKLIKKLKSKEIECKLELNNVKLPKDEMIELLIKEINEIKNNENEDVSSKINMLSNNVKEFENHANNLEDRINYLKGEINNFKSDKNEIFENKNSKTINNFKLNKNEIFENKNSKINISNNSNGKNSNNINSINYRFDYI